MRLLISHGAGINLTNDEERTSLHRAAKGGKVDAVQLLLERGAKLTRDVFGWTPLHSAAAHGHLDSVRALTRNPIDLDGFNYCGSTPLRLAARGGHEDVVKMLLDQGSVINLACDGWTPLHMAVEYGHYSTVETLLDHGANCHSSHEGFDGFYLASSNKDKDIIDLLGRFREDQDLISINRHKPTLVGLIVPTPDSTYLGEENVLHLTPLHLACIHGHADIAELLMKNGANPNAIDGFGKTPSD